MSTGDHPWVAGSCRANLTGVFSECALSLSAGTRPPPPSPLQRQLPWLFLQSLTDAEVDRSVKEALWFMSMVSTQGWYFILTFVSILIFDRLIKKCTKSIFTCRHEKWKAGS